MYVSKRVLLLILLSFAFTLLAGCDADNQDEPAPPFEPQDVTPHSLFFADHERYVGYVLWPDATVDDSNLSGEGYGYGYYYQHRAEAESFDEMMAMCQVPKAILNAMSTRNLVLTCFKHPFSWNFMSYNDEYLGMMVSMQANCFQELMRRRTGHAELLDLFTQLHYGDTVFVRDGTILGSLEYPAVFLCMMTSVDCGVFNQTQVKQIASGVFKHIDDIVEYNSHSDGSGWWRWTLRYPYLVGSVLAYHNDKELQDSERDLLYRFVGWQAMPGSGGENVLTEEDISLSTQIIATSLERLLN